MTEENTTVQPEFVASSRTRRNIVLASLIYSWVVIVVLLSTGEPTNSLHTSALAWAFATNMAVLFAYSFGTIITSFFKK